MSLVGTRPPTLDEWEKYEPHHRARMSFRPGLTGLWQVSGRSNITDFEEVVKLDTKYISEGHLKIFPYDERNITGAGYNLSTMNFAFSIRKHILLKINVETLENGNIHYVNIPPNDTVLFFSNARIFVVTPQLRGEACDNDIRYIASELAKLCDMFEFTYLLDMTAHAPVYDAEMRKSFGLGFHPNPMGYYAYALIVGNYIDYIIRSNPQEFATIPFVGTLLKNKDYK